MKQFRHIALIAALAVSCAANDASAQAISNVLIPPQTVVGNLQGVPTGAQALTFNELRQALSLTGILLSPPALPTPGNAIVFGAAPNLGITVDAGFPPMLLSPVPAYTLKGNATGSTAIPTDISIPALTAKTIPVSNDIVLIQRRCRLEQHVKLFRRPQHSARHDRDVVCLRHGDLE
jgi:hypothetical protein